MKNWDAVADILIIISLFAVLLSSIGSLDYDIWLASTQWLEVAMVLAIYAIYIKVSENRKKT